MAKYYVDWEEIEGEDAPVLIEAVARYMSAAGYLETGVMCSILGIKKEKEETK